MLSRLVVEKEVLRLYVETGQSFFEQAKVSKAIAKTCVRAMA